MGTIATERVVRVRVEVAHDAVRLHVTDEGNGFDPTGVPDPTLPERLEREDGPGSVRAEEPRGPGRLQREREFGVPDAPGRADPGRAAAPFSSGSPECGCGCGAWARPPRHRGRRGSSRFPNRGVVAEIGNGGRQSLTPGASPGVGRELAEIIGSVLSAERDAVQVAAELSERYEEIDLIYTISEILGHTIRLDEAADRILREVSTVVGARRATLLVHDAEAAGAAHRSGAGIVEKDPDSAYAYGFQTCPGVFLPPMNSTISPASLRRLCASISRRLKATDASCLFRAPLWK